MRFGVIARVMKYLHIGVLLLQVPALEHNGKVIGESLDLIKYVDSNFEGPALLPDVRFCRIHCCS